MNEVVTALDSYQYSSLRKVVGTDIAEDSCYELCKFVEEFAEEFECASADAVAEAVHLEGEVTAKQEKHDMSVTIKVFTDGVEDYDEMPIDQLENLYKWAKQFAEDNYDATLNS